MPENFDISSFFNAVIKQDAEKLRKFFKPDAVICWANTNEQFTVDEYIRANCEYPGDWNGRIEEFEIIKNTIHDKKMVVVAKVWDSKGFAARTVSFIDFDGYSEDELIDGLTEYWSDIGEPPEWRQNMSIGKRYKDEDMKH
jgi:hypothetical protein